MTGALTSIGFTAQITGAGTSVVAEPSGRFAYVTDGFNNNVIAYAIDPSSGMLTAIPGSPFTTGTDPFSAAVDISGEFAYVANTLSGNVSMFTISPNTGALTSVGTIAAGTHPGSVATTGTIQ
jgi:6-phosphogluconolactonase (cycloisomerase 2 family)